MFDVLHHVKQDIFITTKGMELFKTITANNTNDINWRTNKPSKEVEIGSCFNLPAVHTRLMLGMFAQIAKKEKQPSHSSKLTFWAIFREESDN